MSIYLFLAIPFLISIIYFILCFNKVNNLYPSGQISRYGRNPRKSKLFSAGMVAVLLAILSAGILAGLNESHKAEKFTDVEIWNGRVTAKNRHHGQYTETYSCNCRTKTRRVSYTTTSGSGKNARTVTKYRTEQYQECDTCSRQWYTVKWNCSTTFGDINVAKVESLSTGVYNTPNPQAFEKIVVGEPASTTKNYTNYLQGSDFSILKNRGMTIPPEIKIPAYPTNVYDIYKINRFFTDLPFTQSELDQWNEMVANLNRDVGGPKQANIIIYVTKHGTDFADMVEARWEGLNKNDIVLVIGMGESKPKWAKVLSWTKREDFKIHVRDRVMRLTALDMTGVSAILTEEVAARFERRQMKEFEYLENEIQIPMGMFITWLVLTILIPLVVFKFVQPQFWINL